MEDKQILLVLIAAAIGYVGYWIQYWYNKKLESQKHQQNLRTNAYVDFIQGAAGRAIAQKSMDIAQEAMFIKEREATVMLTAAKARISIYGSKEVVASIAEFLSGEQDLRKSECCDKFVNIVQTIRKEALPKDRLFIRILQTIRRAFLPKDQEVSDKDVYTLLFE